jgi:hypothetical protein
LLSYWFGENPHNGAANQDNGTGYVMRVVYQTKMWEAAAAWSKTTYRNTPVSATAGAPSGDFATWNLAASYDFGLARRMAAHARDERKRVVPACTRGWPLAGVVRFGPYECRASVGEYRIDACTALVPRTLQWGMGYVHDLAKRTASDAT